MSALRSALAFLVALPLAGCAVTSSARPSVAASQAKDEAHAMTAREAAENAEAVDAVSATGLGEVTQASAELEAIEAAASANGAVPAAREGARPARAEQASVTAEIDSDAPDDEASAEEEEDEDGVASADEGEASEPSAASAVNDGSTFPRYTADLSDETIAQLFKNDLKALGSVSVGFVEAGRVINAVPFPRDPDWIVVSPNTAWATQETIDYAVAAIRTVKAQYPEAHPLRVNNLSTSEGGWLRPHKSHQNGRDVDFAFYYPTVDPIREREREKYIDVEKNWALVKALVTQTDVQLILVDKRVQKVIYDHALAAGEDKAWLDSLFGPTAIIRHAKRHRDHFHVRFYNGRAQELGRRIAPLLAQRPDQNSTTHRVRSGDNLGKIARKYGTTVSAIQKANRMRTTFLRVGTVLRIPLRGPCTRCPVPPEVIVPPRKLPPAPVPVASNDAHDDEGSPSSVTGQR